MNNNNLIPVFTGLINNQQTNLIDARTLHSYLESGIRFNDWINRRIEEYKFTESVDFIAITQKRVIGHGRGSKEYHLTLDMAKELSMVERTEKGREARRYFIECEKQLLNLTQDICNQECQTRKVTTEQARKISEAVDEYCKKNGVNWQKFYPALKKEFGVESYLDLPAKEFDSVIEYICGEVVEDNFFSKATREQIVFAVALMKAGLAKHLEIDRAYDAIKSEVISIRDRLSKVGMAIDDISKNDGIVYDGLAESQLYLGFDSSISKDAIEVAKLLMKKQLVLDF